VIDSQIFCPRLFDGHRMHHHARLHLRGGCVQRIETDTAASSADAWRLPEGSVLAPGLVDVQVNGGGGHLFNDEPSARTVRAMADAHAAFGTTSLLPTLISDTRAQTGRAIAAVREAIGAGCGVLGIHLEGPFLQVRRRGIHRAELMAEFGPGDLDLLSSLGTSGKTLVTLAPECVPAGTIGALRGRGVQVFAGHTDARFEQLQAAIAEGLTGFTHLFNAMSQLTPREPGAVGAALLHPHTYAGLVLDGHHLAPGSVAVLRAARGTLARVILVSDAVTPAGTPATAFELQGQPIRVEGGRCVDAEGRLAGAAITLADAVRIATTHYGWSLSEALASATRVPAEMLGLADEVGVLKAGARADALVLDAALAPVAVMRAGQWLRPPPMS
jgi:N-acetylglucosamine-6-phosphate deacetylase